MILEIIAGLFVLMLMIYKWSISSFTFWSDRGVTGPAPTPLVGNIGDVIRGKQSIGDCLKKYYDDNSDLPYVGLFSRREPVLLIRSLDLIKDVLISDFSKFSDRALKTYEKADPLSQNLLVLETKRWRPLRHKLSPVFTSGKLKDMFYLLLNCGDMLQKHMDNVIDKNNIIEARDLTARYTTDVIGTCVFGLEINAMNDDDNEFRKMGKQIFKFTWKKVFLYQLRDFFPSVYEFLAPIVKRHSITNFFIKIMKDTMAYRRENKIYRHDFLDYLMEIKDNPEKLPEIKLTDELLASQLFIFFLAGFETSSSTMTNMLYELAQHHDYQDKLREEIRDTLSANDGKLTYDSVKNMKFLDMLFKETLRKYPIGTMLSRKSTSEYTFSGTNLTIPKNTLIFIAVQGIHFDPKFYKNPEIFNPYNFTDKAIKSRHPMSFQAFGDGPRNCVGARFAYQQSKVGIIKMLEKYYVDVCEKTEIPYKVNPKGFLLAPLNGIYLKFTKI
ncbi:cytochrome P450 6A1-like [Aphidius gifuensis]|uniref:cytochrome P450 6A1-like n=1 Tax=Aphidius gifuensis TaxID=684658 RepID=UPI001CDD02A8|nr:cytochrome P450 6A1-like [Aphidius gifuensis]XP_044004565.1 cytochrome P450 6A1-like [Aphidius gifuensis]